MFTVDKNLTTQFAVHDSDTPVIMTGQGHQTWYESVDNKQVHGHAKFQIPCLTHSVLRNEALVPGGGAHAPAERGPHSANSTFVVLKNTAKLKLVSK